MTQFNKLLDNLNTEQKKAVLNTDGPNLIVAGAGSGKTRVLTTKLAYIISEKKACLHTECDDKKLLTYDFYDGKFENLIEDFAIKPGLFSYQIIDKAIFSGLELMCQLRISDQLDSRWGINWVNNVDGQNKTIPNTIPLSLTGAANYKHPKKGHLPILLSRLARDS